jgi:hypothetical protein
MYLVVTLINIFGGHFNCGGYFDQYIDLKYN